MSPSKGEIFADFQVDTVFVLADSRRLGGALVTRCSPRQTGCPRRAGNLGETVLHTANRCALSAHRDGWVSSKGSLPGIWGPPHIRPPSQCSIIIKAPALLPRVWSLVGSGWCEGDWIPRPTTRLITWSVTWVTQPPSSFPVDAVSEAGFLQSIRRISYLTRQWEHTMSTLP